MLILAGVSINAVVGDNGVLSKAQDAVFVNSCAYLEEYFQELYLNIQLEEDQINATQLENIIAAGYESYFFKTSEGYKLRKTSDDGSIVVVYLLVKENLPEEIRSKVTGADNRSSKDYRLLNGVYGITSELDVYYSAEYNYNDVTTAFTDHLVGLNGTLNADSPDAIAFEKETPIANILNGGVEAVTKSDLKAINNITIDNNEKLSVLPNFTLFPNLKYVYFKNVTINNLTGIDGAKDSLIYVSFSNCTCLDYSALSKCINLQYLYLMQPSGFNNDIINLCDDTKGIGKAKLSKLTYLGIQGSILGSGNSTSANATTSVMSTRYNVTDISPLENLESETKEAVKYIYLNNNQITSLASLIDFVNVEYLRLDYNALETLNGIQKMSNLKYLIAPSQYSVELANNKIYADSTATTNFYYTLGSKEVSGTTANTDALSYIYKDPTTNINTKLYYVDLRTQYNLKRVDGLENCTGVKYLYLMNCNRLDANSVSKITNTIAQCGEKYNLQGTYGNILASSGNVEILSLKGLKIDQSDFEALANNSNLKYLDIDSLTIYKTGTTTALTNKTTPTFDSVVNTTLSKCTKLQEISADSNKYLYTISFVKSIGSNIKWLSLKNTNVLTSVDTKNVETVSGTEGLELLNTYCSNLLYLNLNNVNIKIPKIATTINKVSNNVYDYNSKNKKWPNNHDVAFGKSGSDSSWGMCLGRVELLSQLNDCGSAITKYYCCDALCGTTYKSSEIVDWTGMTELKRLYYIGLTCKYKMPANLEYCYTEWLGYGLDLSVAKKINYLRFCYGGTSEIRAIDNDALSSTLQSLSLSENTSLRTLSLYCCARITSLESLDYIKNIGLTNLECFNSGASVYTGSLLSVNGIEKVTTLNTIDLSYQPIKDISSLSTLKNLTTLNMDHCQIMDISSLQYMPQLSKVYLNNNVIKNLTPLENCPLISILYLNNNNIADIYPLRNLKNMTYLNLSNCGLNDLGYHKIDGVSKAYEVIRILFSLNSQAKNGGNLSKLYISGNNFDDKELLNTVTWEDRDW